MPKKRVTATKRRARRRISDFSLLSPGDRIQVEFLDHCQRSGGEARPVFIELEGRFVAAYKEYFVVTGWLADKELNGDNTDTYAIVKHSSLKVWKL